MQADSRQRTCSGSRSFQHIFPSVCQAVELAKHPLLIPSPGIKGLHQTRVMQAEGAHSSEQTPNPLKSPHISLMVVSAAFASSPASPEQGSRDVCIHTCHQQCRASGFGELGPACCHPFWPLLPLGSAKSAPSIAAGPLSKGAVEEQSQERSL